MLYSKIEESKVDEDLKESIEYHKAVALFNSGEYKDAKMLLENYLKEFPDSEWNQSILYYLNRVDIKM